MFLATVGMSPFRYLHWFGLVFLFVHFQHHLAGLRKSSNIRKINNANILPMKNGRNTNVLKKLEIEILNFKKPFILWRWYEGNYACLAPLKTGLPVWPTVQQSAGFADSRSTDNCVAHSTFHRIYRSPFVGFSSRACDYIFSKCFSAATSLSLNLAMWPNFDKMEH